MDSSDAVYYEEWLELSFHVDYIETKYHEHQGYLSFTTRG